MGASAPVAPPRPAEAPTQSPFFLIGREDAAKRVKKRGLKSQGLLSDNSSSGSSSKPKQLLGQ